MISQMDLTEAPSHQGTMIGGSFAPTSQIFKRNKHLFLKTYSGSSIAPHTFDCLTHQPSLSLLKEQKELLLQ